MTINERVETLIIKCLLNKDEYLRRVLPFLKEIYFRVPAERYIIKEIQSFVSDYNSTPTKEAILIRANEDSISDDLYKEVVAYINDLTTDGLDELNMDWIIDKTEEFCKEEACRNSLSESIKILNGEDKNRDKGCVPELLKDALAVSFDPNIGHDYMEDAEARYEEYHNEESRISYDLDYFNRITNGGTPNKTLNIILAGTGVGKSLSLCHFAAASMAAGYNVLYITLELSENKVAERIDANLLNVPIHELKELPKDIYLKRFDALKGKIVGKLKVKEYPTASANVNHFRALMEDYKIKLNFVPDIIFVDYLNLMTSSRLRDSSNSYFYIKSIAEELRGFAVEYDVPIFSATQVTRSGYTSTDIGLEDTSESFGLPATADFMIAMTSNEELEKMNQVLFKQLKNRYNDVSLNRRFIVGIDRSKMKLFDVEESAQITSLDTKKTNKKEDDKPLFDKTDFGNGMKAERRDKFDDIDMF
jgi:replicative DNA helicase